jgi:hypothetical protein
MPWEEALRSTWPEEILEMMSRTYAGKAARDAVERYITADGFNDDEEVIDYLLSTTDDEILEEMQEDGWDPPNGVTWDQMADGLAEAGWTKDQALHLTDQWRP